MMYILEVRNFYYESFSPEVWTTTTTSRVSRVRLCATPWTAAYQASSFFFICYFTTFNSQLYNGIFSCLLV